MLNAEENTITRSWQALLWDTLLAWPRTRWLQLAASLSFVAEIIHLFVLPLQYEIFFLYGLFFLLAAMAQGITGALLLFTPGLRVLRWATRINAFLVGSYTITHTLGVLTGIGFTRLSVDAPGIIATMAALGIVIALVIARHQHTLHHRQGSSSGISERRRR